jgi:magnesium transporter
MRFELTKEYLQTIEMAIESNDTSWITENILELHDADIAAIIGEFDHEFATDLFNRIPSDRKGDILIELDDDSREHLLKGYQCDRSCKSTGIVRL